MCFCLITFSSSAITSAESLWTFVSFSLVTCAIASISAMTSRVSAPSAASGVAASGAGGAAGKAAKGAKDAPCFLTNPDAWLDNVVWHYEKFDNSCPSVYKRWSLKGNPLRGYQLMRIVKEHYYVKRGVSLRLFPRRNKISSVRLGKRHTLNNRDEDQSRKEYCESILLDGYHGEKRSPPYYMKVKECDIEFFKSMYPAEVDEEDLSDWEDLADDVFFFWLLGAATCAEGGYDAIRLQPENPNCIGLFSEGLENSIEVHMDAPTDVVTWVVNDANKFQSGSGFSVQQLLFVTEEYGQSWASKKKDMAWSNKTFGKGPYSHDNQMWAHLKATYQEDLRFRLRTHFEKANGIIHQLKAIKAYEPLRHILKTQFNHKHKALNLETWVRNAWECEHALRNDCSDIADRMKPIIFLSLVKFTMPLVEQSSTSILNDIYSKFIWKDEKDHADINALCNVDTKFVPSSVSVESAGRVVITNSKAGKTGKRKKDGEENAVAPPAKKRAGKAQPQESQAGEDVDGVKLSTVAVLKFPVAVSEMVREGVSHFEATNTPLPDSVVDRMGEMAVLLFNFALAGTASTLADDNTVITFTGVADARKLRRHVFTTLNTISIGYMKMRGIPLQAHATPSSNVAPLPDDPAKSRAAAPVGFEDAQDASIAAAAAAEAGGADGDRGDAGDVDEDELDVDALSAADAFSFLQWLRENSCVAFLKLQPAYRRCADRILNAFAAEPSIGCRDALSMVVMRVSEEIRPEWVNEVVARPESGHFFDDKTKAMHFMHLRHAYITTLLEQFCCGSTRVNNDGDAAPVLDIFKGSGQIDCLRVGDAGQESLEDVETFWATALMWATDRVENPESATVASLEEAVDALTPCEPVGPTESESQANGIGVPGPTGEREPANAGDGSGAIVGANATADTVGEPDTADTEPDTATTATSRRRLRCKAPLTKSESEEPVVTFQTLDTTWGNRFGQPGSSTKKCRFLKLLKCTAELNVTAFAYKHLPNKRLSLYRIHWQNEMDAHKNMRYSMPSDPDFKFVFHGRVTAFPSGKQHLQLCKSGGCIFYLVPDDEFFSPSWHIPASTDDAEITCELKNETLDFNVMQGSTKVPIKATVHYLVPRSGIDFSDGSTFMVRPKLPSEEGGAKLPEHLKASRKLSYSDLVFNAIGWKYQATRPPNQEETPQDTTSTPQRPGDKAQRDRWAHIRSFTKF